MNAPRRRVLRPPATPSATNQQREQAREKLAGKLAKEQATFRRWMTRLKRAFHVVERQERKVARLEKALARL
jgi:hypothetical protein